MSQTSTDKQQGREGGRRAQCEQVSLPHALMLPPYMMRHKRFVAGRSTGQQLTMQCMEAHCFAIRIGDLAAITTMGGGLMGRIFYEWEMGKEVVTDG